MKLQQIYVKCVQNFSFFGALVTLQSYNDDDDDDDDDDNNNNDDGGGTTVDGKAVNRRQFIATTVHRIHL